MTFKEFLAEDFGKKINIDDKDWAAYVEMRKAEDIGISNHAIDVKGTKNVFKFKYEEDFNKLKAALEKNNIPFEEYPRTSKSTELNEAKFGTNIKNVWYEFDVEPEFDIDEPNGKYTVRIIDVEESPLNAFYYANQRNKVYYANIKSAKQSVQVQYQDKFAKDYIDFKGVKAKTPKAAYEIIAKYFEEVYEDLEDDKEHLSTFEYY